MKSSTVACPIENSFSASPRASAAAVRAGARASRPQRPQSRAGALDFPAPAPAPAPSRCGRDGRAPARAASGMVGRVCPQRAACASTRSAARWGQTRPTGARQFIDSLREKTLHGILAVFLLTFLTFTAPAQVLLNVDFGVGTASAKTGFAATGQGTNDHWNLYRHYSPKYLPGMALVADGLLENLKLADASATKVSLAVSNAPGVWGNATGDPMYDGYIFPLNGSNLTVTVRNLDPGNYHFFLYGHADADVTGEQNSVFTLTSGALTSGTNTFGPLTALGSAGWKATAPWQERQQYVVFRDVTVFAGQPVRIDVAPGPNGVAVLNGLQIFSRGTSPPKLAVPLLTKASTASTNLFFHQLRYDGKISDTEARFSVFLQAESMTTNVIAAPLFTGDVAVLAPALPEGVRIVNAARQFRLVATQPGIYDLEFEIIAKITRQEPWNHISFTGPAAALAEVTAKSTVPGVELQLLSGTPALEEPGKTNARAPGIISGFLGADRTLALRWQGKTVEVARKSLVTVDTVARAHLTPTVIKYTTDLTYDVVQGSVPRLVITLPANQTITQISGGAQVRDWQVKPDGARQTLTIEFIKPLEKSAVIKIFSEQPLDAATAALLPPEPTGVDRESGSFTVSAEEMLVEVDTATGLRQVNATGGALAAYRFYGRPFALSVKVKRLEPIVNVNDRVSVRLEETRLLVTHTLSLNVERAGIYFLELAAQTNFTVADVRGEGVDDWKITDGKLRVNFKNQVLGARRLEVQLEQPHKQFPAQLDLAPLRVTGATKETGRIGAAAAQGIRLKTVTLAGLREVPVNLIGPVGDEILGYLLDQPDWKLSLAPERLPARVLAEVFNLITIGDGQVGGSATIRYGILNQGVQQFRVKLPAHWKNVEFTGPNIRRKESATNIWTISLQDKVWGGYTLVVTYDHQFNPSRATLDAAGAHVLDVERETGSVAITTAASLKLEPRPVAEPLRKIDPTELADTDRALITRPVLLAYRYTGGDFALALELTRHEQAQVLSAVADRTQITSVLTEAGEMLTQASFMVKNNDKQFQKFQLPADAALWGVYVNGEPVKAERDGEFLLVSLPRTANRDQAFAVDLVYAQTFASLKKLLPSRLHLEAPRTDVPNTYAEWTLYAPFTQRLSGFDGSMTAARGTTYGWRDAWEKFVEFYGNLWDQGFGMLIGLLVVVLVVWILYSATRKRGAAGLLTALVLFAFAGILASMLLPALGKAKAKASRIKTVNNLKQIGTAAQVFRSNHGRLPLSFEEMMGELGSEKVLYDAETGERLIYVGAGKTAGDANALLAYAVRPGGRNDAAFADGSVQQLTAQSFEQAIQRDLQRSMNPMAGGDRSGAVDMPTGGAPAERAKAMTPMPAGKPMSGPVPTFAPPMSPPPPVASARQRGLAEARKEMSAREGEQMERLADPSRPGVSAAAKRAQEAFNETVVMNQAQALNAVDSDAGVVNPTGRTGGGSGQAKFGFITGLGANGAVQTDGVVVAGGLVMDNRIQVSGQMAIPTATGIRSIRIDIPKTGQSFNFTKVLNVGREPLSVQATAMRTKVFSIAQMILQLAAFLIGLCVCWHQWNKPDRSSLALTVGAVLALGAVINLFLALRMLHVVLVLVTGVLALVLLVALFRRLLPRRKPASPDDNAPSAPDDTAPPAPAAPTPPSPSTPSAPTPAVTALLLLLALASASAQPLDSAARPSYVPAGAVPSATIVSAKYVGRVGEKVAQFNATLQILSVATNQTVRLFGDDVAVQSFVADGSSKLVRDGDTVSVWLPEKGEFTCELKLLVRLGGDVTRRLLAFGSPSALASTFSADLDEPDADVEFPSAVSFKRVTQGKQTHVEAVLGATDRVELQWTPRVKRVADMEATIFCMNSSLITLGGGVVHTRTILNYQISQGELRQAKVRLPAGQRLLRVAGDGVRTWELISEGANEVVVVDLLKGVAPAWKVTVETEKPLPALPAALKLEVPHAGDVKRENGLVAVRGSEELSVFVDGAPGLQRVDNGEFSRGASPPVGELVSAYRFLKPGFAVAVRVEAVTSLIEASLRNHFFIRAEGLQVLGVAEYEVKRAGVFGFKLVLPPGLRLDTVLCASDTGDKVSQWNERTENGVRVLDIALKERVLGRVFAQVSLSTNYAAPPRSLPLVGVHPLGVQKLTGYVSVNAEPGVSVKTDVFDGLSEVPAASLLTAIKPVPTMINSGAQQQVMMSRMQPYVLPPGQTPSLAFKLITVEPGPLASWKLTVATEPMEAWVRAEVVNVLTLSETLLSGRAVVRYDIQNAPVKEFRVRVPAGVKNVELLGAAIRRRDETNSEWRVELQNKVRGTFTLTVTWENPRDAKTNQLDFAGVQALGVERENGSLAVLAKAPLQVVEKSASEELVKIDARELPDWAGVSGIAARSGAEAAVMAYRYLRPGYKLTLDVRRYDEAAVLQALVDSVTLTTVVADDGQMMTEMKLAVRNNGRQHLEIELPPDATIWSAFVAGQPVRPGQRAGKLLLPLERSGADEAPVAVELVFVGTNKFPRVRGDVNLASPKLDVPLKNARWNLYLPLDYEYRDFEGSMTHGSEVAAAVASSYTLDDYTRQEVSARVLNRDNFVSSLSNARSQLSAGNYKDFNGTLKQAAANSYRDESTVQELKKLEDDVRKVQGSNLLQAQQRYVAKNNEQADSSGWQSQGQREQQQVAQAAQPAQQAGEYDLKVAEQQWGKLQQAQEIAEVTVQPLRVNLPTRGLRHSFTQVLQTGVDKPMTIKFTAMNTTRPGWFKTLLFAVGGFLLLWIIAASLPERRQR